MRSWVKWAGVSAVLGLAAVASAVNGWRSFVSPDEVEALRQADPNLVILDVRPEKDYLAGHLPGAINLPGDQWRTPAVKAGQGDSQYIFRDANGKPDVAKYEAILSNIGLSRDRPVVVYGDHAGKATGSVPAAILHWLGQREVYFLDGVGVQQWVGSGRSLETTVNVNPPSSYDADPIEHFVWNLDDVLSNIGSKNVIFYDTRSAKEFAGIDKRDNARGGHIPGAVLIDYADFLDKEQKTVLPREVVEQKLAEKQITKDKTIVLYCQTATRTSLPLLALKDLGYTNVVLYDASWHEYGNRNDTPIETPEETAKAGG